MSIIKKLSTLPEAIRRHLAGEAVERPINVEKIEVLVPEARVSQFGYGDDLDDDTMTVGMARLLEQRLGGRDEDDDAPPELH